MKNSRRNGWMATAAALALIGTLMTGCRGPAAKAGKTAAGVAVKGAKTSAKATAGSAKAVGGAAVGAVTPGGDKKR